MENENKNTPQQHNQGEKKRKHQKPKSYFIEPASQTTQSASSATHEPKLPHQNAEKAAQKQRTASNNRNAHKKNHHGRPRDIDKKQEDQIEKKDPSQKEKAAETPDIIKDQRAKHNRNKHRNKPKNKVQNVENKPQETENESNDQTIKQLEKPVQQDGIRKQKRRPDRLIPKATPIPDNAPSSTEYEPVQLSSEPLDVQNTTVEEAPSPMIEVVGIRFKSSGKMYYFAPGDKTLHRGEHAIVETARGLEYGDVAMGNTMVKESDTVPPLRPVVRVATPADVKHHEENKKKEDEAFAVCNEKIIAHKLDMKLIDAQFTFDNSKLLFYFTSSGRVDFRDLVKDLASVFRTRIELRQIGIRDEAKIMGGVGMCGRPLCCTLFLSDFGQVSIKMAKEQNLSLNCAKISGICGRLMCCLRYEHETYEYEIKRTPPVDSIVQTADGIGSVTEISPLLGTIKVRLNASPENPPKVYKREDVVMLQKKTSKDPK